MVEIEEQLADLNEDKNHKFLELDDIDNEVIAIAGALGLTGANGFLNGVIDAVDIKGGRIDMELNNKITALEEERQQLLQEREELEY